MPIMNGIVSISQQVGTRFLPMKTQMAAKSIKRNQSSLLANSLAFLTRNFKEKPLVLLFGFQLSTTSFVLK